MLRKAPIPFVGVVVLAVAACWLIVAKIIVPQKDAEISVKQSTIDYLKLKLDEARKENENLSHRRAIDAAKAQPHEIVGFTAFEATLALQLEAQYEAIKEKRAAAASSLSEYLQNGNWGALTNSEGLDDVLDFFEDLGLYWKKQQVSEIALHHYFYSAMRTYCQNIENYIADVQKEEGGTIWENVEPLFKRLTEIEAEKLKRLPSDCRWDKATQLDYLKSEMKLKP